MSTINCSRPPLSSSLRIACLTPSATDICIALDLTDCIVGVTHECILRDCKPILTLDGVQQPQHQTNIATQREIHNRVVQAIQTNDAEEVASLYPIQTEEFRATKPTVILTQDLCGVCAPSSQQVEAILGETNSKRIPAPTIVSLSPNNLDDVLQSMVTVAAACGIRERGVKLRDELKAQLETLQQTILKLKNHHTEEQEEINGFLFEWLDPPFDGGHWIPDMMHYAGILSPVKTSTKSVQLSWDTIPQTAADPTVVWIAGCGLDMPRNAHDAKQHSKELARACPRAWSRNAIFATNGDLYFARPGPHLITGVCIMALSAHQEHTEIVNAILQLPFVPDACRDLFCAVNFKESDNNDNDSNNVSRDANAMPDIEDWGKLHQEACSQGQSTYKDPATGYSVFTAVAHKKRGFCCGSGCRHCPYNHENIKPELKAAKIQQPAVLHTGEDSTPSSQRSAVFAKDTNVHVLFNSGGKDSFLTLRALVRKAKEGPTFTVVLLTTFDASSRTIAHQDVHIEQVVKQAKHLGLPLVGVPMHRGSSESYVDRIEKALNVVEDNFGKIDALVFGDLHLDHIRDWRQKEMTKYGYPMLYPLWKSDYESLEQDLELSAVPCSISSSNVADVTVGETYNADLRRRLRVGKDSDIDVFGEKGEFHSLAKVWEVSRDKALGWDGLSEDNV